MTTALEGYKAILNILEDSRAEKERLEGTQRAVFNILDDFAAEKARAEEIQRATMNILEDFDAERLKVNAANRELSEAFDSLRRAKDAAEAANRELEAFSYSVSHDLRTPLRSINGFSQALLEDYEHVLDEAGRDHLRRVRAATQRMAQLIDDLLKLSRLTRSEVNITTVDLSYLARTIAQELLSAAPERRVKFLITDGLTAQTDPHLVKIVLENLIGNAWKFTSRKDEAVIEFGITLTDGAAAYFVRDNGAGFDMAYAGKLFVTFQRLHSDKDFSGTGIGLSLVHRIIRRLGGRIWAEGAVDKGAAFYFLLS